MAYSDYGAFVYKYGKRRHDKEDASIYATPDDGHNDIPAGMRVFAHHIERLENMDEAERESLSEDDRRRESILGGLYHGVLGDNDIRVAIYKVGISMTHLVYIDPETGEAEILDGEDMLRLAIGDEVTSYDSLGECPEWNPDDEEATKAHDAWFDAYRAFRAQFDGAYDYSFEWHGAKFRMTGKDYEEGSLCVTPHYAIHMVDADGSVWDAFYDASYGSGFQDDGEESAYAEISDGKPPVSWTTMKVSLTDGNFWEGEDIDASLSLVFDEEGRILYRGEELWGTVGEGIDDEVTSVSTLRHDSFVEPSDYIDILNEGIRLAKMGIDQVESNGWGGCNQDGEGLDDFARIDFMWGRDKDGEAAEHNDEIYEMFRGEHAKFRDSLAKAREQAAAAESAPKLGECIVVELDEADVIIEFEPIEEDCGGE